LLPDIHKNLLKCENWIVPYIDITKRMRVYVGVSFNFFLSKANQFQTPLLRVFLKMLRITFAKITVPTVTFLKRIHI